MGEGIAFSAGFRTTACFGTVAPFTTSANDGFLAEEEVGFTTDCQILQGDIIESA